MDSEEAIKTHGNCWDIPAGLDVLGLEIWHETNLADYSVLTKVALPRRVTRIVLLTLDNSLEVK